MLIFLLRHRHTTGAGVLLLALLVLAVALSAHDFWLVPNAFRIAPGGTIEVRGQTSSRFPTSESAVALDRVAQARVVGANEDTPVRDLSHAGASLMLRHRPTTPGQRIVAVALKPRSVRESAESFRRYIVLEGAPEALERYEREGRLPAPGDSITRRYTKYAKALVEVGTRGPRAYSRPVGHTLEFIPLTDPEALQSGGTLPVRLVFRGRPLAGARVHAGTAGAEDGPALTTDGDGVARIPVARDGTWNVRTIQIVPADAGSGAHWDAHWATLVWNVRGSGGGTVPTRSGSDTPGPATSDSAAVVATVERFHRALATGDSAAALALLAPDAQILESGGVETRAEYRSHHLPGDIAFARAVSRQRGPLRVTVRDDVAWAVSTSITQGQYRDRAVNSQGAELMVLTRTPQGWRIAAVHWSSRARRQ